jgi:hypothetical protein
MLRSLARPSAAKRTDLQLSRIPAVFFIDTAKNIARGPYSEI